MPFLVISIDVTKGRLVAGEHHDAELSAILQQTHSAMVMRALPQELYDTEGTPVGEVRYQEGPPGMSQLPYASGHAGNAAPRSSPAPKGRSDGKAPRSRAKPPPPSQPVQSYMAGRGTGRAPGRRRK